MSLEDLPTVEEALKLPEKDYSRYVAGVLENKYVCYIFTIPQKLEDWCKHLGCVDSEKPCSNLPPLAAVTSNSLLNNTATWASGLGAQTQEILWPIINSSIASMGWNETDRLTSQPLNLHQIGYNGTCYDDFHCLPAWTGPLHHVTLGLGALVLCLIAVFLNALYVPAFRFHGNVSGTEIFLTGIVVWDAVYLILIALVVVLQYIPADYVDQLRVYSGFSAYLTPYGLPIVQLAELMSVWLVIGLLFDRYLYVKHGLYAKTMLNRRRAIQMKVVMFVILLSYTIPKFFEFELVPVSGSSSRVRVLRTELGRDVFYQNLMTHWLKVPIELFLPQMTAFVFVGMLLTKLAELHPSLRGGQIKFSQIGGTDFSSSASIAKTKRDLVYRRESQMAVLSLWLGIFLLAAKLPKFTLHVLHTEDLLAQKTYIVINVVTLLLDIFIVFCKPFIYAYICRSYTDAIINLFLCRGPVEDVYYSTDFKEATSYEEMLQLQPFQFQANSSSEQIKEGQFAVTGEPSSNRQEVDTPHIDDKQKL